MGRYLLLVLVGMAAFAGEEEDAVALHERGFAAYDRGDLDGAEKAWRACLAIVERLVPRSLPVAMLLNNLGNIRFARGDWAAAEAYHRRALVIRERLAPGSTDAAASLNNLGLVVAKRGNLASAEAYHKRALAIKERLAPGSLDVADSLNNLGNVARERSDLAAAELYYLRSLFIVTLKAPGSLDFAATASNLAIVAFGRGDLARAEAYYLSALAIYEKKAPDSLHVAGCLINLGGIAAERGDLAAAEAFHRRALAIYERRAPDSLDLAHSLSNLGCVLLDQRQPGKARERFSRAADLVERQRGLVGSTEGRALFAEQEGRHYTGLLRADVALNDLPAAFTTIERSRGRALVEALVERALDLSDAPEALRDKQTQLDNQRQMAYRQLGRCDPQKDGKRIDQLRAEIERLGIEQRQLAADLRRANPKYATLGYPEPLDLPSAQTALERGTLLLTYLVDKGETFLFAVTRDEFKLHRIPVKVADLRQQVIACRGRAAGGSLRDIDVVATPGAIPTRSTPVSASGNGLYDLLLRPAQA
ncbi:MAG: tetratricopeptide repeat protein, partial [Armatimonadetes bacterium]|nr:tetratricopeptide repeat protein [Armatimonadota bacterium]